MDVIEAHENTLQRMKGSFEVALEKKSSNLATALKPLLTNQAVVKGTVSCQGATLTVDHQSLGAFHAVDPAKLLALSKPASFGHGSETKFDTSVRDAWEIKQTRLQASDWKPLLKDISVSLEKKMLPGLAFSLIPYKLQAYATGGHFQAHTDTLHDPHHIGTLLLRLPLFHKGGALEISGSEDLKITWKVDDRYWDYDSQKVLPGPNPHEVAWIAFYTDLPHQVLPVTEGHRVVVQFEIYLHDQESKEEVPFPQAWYIHQAPDEGKNEDKDDNDDETFVSRLIQDDFSSETKLTSSLTQTVLNRKLVKVAEELQDCISHGIHPGFFLEHMYPLAALASGCFKGVDLQLKQIFEKLGYRVYGLPVTLDSSWGYDEESSADLTLSAWDVELPEDLPCSDTWKVFCVPGLNNYRYELARKDAVAWTGNESEIGELQVISGIMVVSFKALRAG